MSPDNFFPKCNQRFAVKKRKSKMIRFLFALPENQLILQKIFKNKSKGSFF